MTDKEQIMIDGVNVSGCRHLKNDGIKKPICRSGGCIAIYKSCLCAKNTDCDYKQLARKTQECEELKKQHENDKGLITSTGKMNYQLLQEYDKLKNCLTEIKEIAEIEIECKTYEIEHDCFNETRCKALNEHIDFTPCFY